jgi:hypothetical protein
MTGPLDQSSFYTSTELDPNHNYKPAKIGPGTHHVINPGDHPDVITPAGSSSTKVPSGVVHNIHGHQLHGPDAIPVEEHFLDNTPTPVTVITGVGKPISDS